MNKQIFRNVALARMASPDRLDQLVRVTSGQSWVALSAILLIIGCATLWGFKGRLVTRADAKGVVVRTGNLLTVSTLAQGQVMDVKVKAGDKLRPGQLVAVISQPEITDKIRAARAQLSDAEEQERKRRRARSGGSGLELETVKQQRAALDLQIAAANQQIQDVKDQIPGYQDLLKRGLVTRQQLLQLKEKQADLESQISNYRSQMVQLSANEFKIQNSSNEADLQGDSQLADLRRQVRLLEDQLSLHTEVTSPYAGQVIEVLSRPGALMAPGGQVLTLQPDVDELEVVAFVPAQKAKEVRPGMEVSISPASVKPEEYGFMKGTVRSVDEYPSTDSHIVNVFQNNALAAAVGGGPVHEVRITLTRDKNTESGFAWSSKGGAPVRITPATLCTVGIATREQAPVTLVIPTIERVLGWLR